MLYGYETRIRRIGEEKPDASGQKRYSARCRVVERTLGWLSKCRGVLVKHEKKARYYFALVKPERSPIWYRRWYRLEF